MRKITKIMIVLILLLAVIFCAATICVGVFGPQIIKTQIKENLKLESSLEKVRLSFPLKLTLEEFKIDNLLSIRKLSFTPNIFGFLFGKVVIHGLDIIEPSVNLEQSAQGKLNLPLLTQGGPAPQIILTSLKVQNGKIKFIDKKVSAEGKEIILEKLNLKISKVSLPLTSLAVNFSFTAELVSPQEAPYGKISFSGWLDYFAQAMDAQLEIKNLEVTNFAPYYGNFISQKKLSSANLDLVSKFKAQNNVLNIVTDFNLSKIVYALSAAQDKEEAPLDLNLAKNALDLFTDRKGSLHLEFELQTALDKPTLSQEKIQSVILKAALQNLSQQSPQDLVDKVTDIISQYKDLGKELKGIFGSK